MTSKNTPSGLRNRAAMLVTLSGFGQIASLWYRELTGAALADAVLGTIYIFVGIGLLGRSRFPLVVAIAVPAAAAGLLLKSVPGAQLALFQIIRLVIDAVVILIAATELWRVRNSPAD